MHDAPYTSFRQIDRLPSPWYTVEIYDPPPPSLRQRISPLPSSNGPPYPNLLAEIINGNTSASDKDLYTCHLKLPTPPHLTSSRWELWEYRTRAWPDDHSASIDLRLTLAPGQRGAGPSRVPSSSFIPSGPSSNRPYERPEPHPSRSSYPSSSSSTTYSPRTKYPSSSSTSLKHPVSPPRMRPANNYGDELTSRDRSFLPDRRVPSYASYDKRSGSSGGGGRYYDPEELRELEREKEEHLKAKRMRSERNELSVGSWMVGAVAGPSRTSGDPGDSGAAGRSKRSKRSEMEEGRKAEATERPGSGGGRKGIKGGAAAGGREARADRQEPGSVRVEVKAEEGKKVKHAGQASRAATAVRVKVEEVTVKVEDNLDQKPTVSDLEDAERARALRHQQRELAKIQSRLEAVEAKELRHLQREVERIEELRRLLVGQKQMADEVDGVLKAAAAATAMARAELGDELQSQIWTLEEMIWMARNVLVEDQEPMSWAEDTGPEDATVIGSEGVAEAGDGLLGEYRVVSPPCFNPMTDVAPYDNPHTA